MLICVLCFAWSLLLCACHLLALSNPLFIGSYAAFGINRKGHVATVQPPFLLPLPTALVHGIAVHWVLQGHLYLLRNQRQ
ncbi:gp39 protein [Vibrio phage VP585]|uniref:Gp39 protein n=1 Tax=Vibrio phage VP585 TaxID=631719 RepID=D4HTX8_9CAUD|nr:gp39 protein [Vibrio phage VP585]CAX65020.1 gp39 protein [Vibrio phage VP585]